MSTLSSRSLTGFAAIPPLVLFACMGNCEYWTLRMPAEPLHLEAVSSPFDDWNCGDPDQGGSLERSLLFSSNRGSAGGQFDLVPEGPYIHGKDTALVGISMPDRWVKRLADTVNTQADELGPSFWSRRTSRGSKVPGALVFSRGSRSDHDLWAVLPSDEDRFGLLDTGLLPERSLDPLNTPSDEGYLTWDSGWSRVFFHSNRGGRYRILQAEVPMDSAGPFSWLARPTAEGMVISEVPGLQAGDGEERCPFLRGDTLYFVSDRSGGLGGFDIYRSVWKAPAWSQPENLGPAVNSSADEYRPHPTLLDGYGESLLFSSNRPGGLGGYDLYLAGLRRR